MFVIEGSKSNETFAFKNVNNYLNTNIYSNLEMSGGQNGGMVGRRTPLRCTPSRHTSPRRIVIKLDK